MKDKFNYNSTKDITVSDKISDRIIGQDLALNLIKKAAKQKRNVLLIGEPGTGKSMLGQGLSEMLEKEP
ncbi:ATP-dependent protease LonB, partial [Candidatus Pacearchaeota archaeon CG_4_9_14_3_um_filter_31_7]